MTIVEELRQVAARMATEPDVFDVDFEVAPPVTAEEVRAAEERLGAKLPEDLVALYTTTCGALYFAWRIRDNQTYRLGDEDDTHPGGDVDLRAPGKLRRSRGDDYVIVFSDGAGNGIALDLSDEADPAEPWVTYDHDIDAAEGMTYRDLAHIFQEMRELGFGSDDVTPVTENLLEFLGGRPLHEARVQ